MGKLILTIEGVDYSQYFRSFTASPSGPGVIGSAELHLSKQAGGLDILVTQEVNLYFAFNAAGAGVQARGRIFGGFVAQRTEGNYGDEKTWVLSCVDYNVLGQSLKRYVFSPIVLSAASFADQIQAVVIAVQGQGSGVVNTVIDSSTYVANLHGAMPADELSGGKDLNYYIDYLCQKAQYLTPALRPRFFFGMSETASVTDIFNVPALKVYDAANFGSAHFTHDESNIIISHSRTTGRGNMPVQELQAMYAHHSGQSQAAIYTETAAATLYPCKYVNDGLTGDMGYWSAAAISDSNSVDFDQAEAALKRKVQPLAYPSDTFEYYTMDWVKPGDVIDYSWALSGHANELMRVVGVAVELENPDKLVSRITLNTRRLTLFDTGEEFYTPPVEGDVVPPTDVASVTLDSNVFDETIDTTRMIWSWPASTSPDVTGYRVSMIIDGGLAPIIDVGDVLTYTGLVEPGSADVELTVWAYDSHGNISLDGETATAADASPIISTHIYNPSLEALDPDDATLPKGVARTLAGNGTAVVQTGTPGSVHSGIRCAKFTAVGGGATAKFTHPFKKVQGGRSQALTLWARASAGASILWAAIDWYDADQAYITTTTALSGKAVTTTFALYSKVVMAPRYATLAKVSYGLNATTAATLYVDDIDLSYSPPATVNGGGGGRIGQGWEPVYSTDASAEFNAAEVYTGSESLALVATPNITAPASPTPSVWYKPGALVGLSDGDAVGTMTDSGSLGKDATQATGSKKPLYKTNIVNSRPVLRFDGVDDWMQSAAFASALAQPNTVMAVSKRLSGTAQVHILDGLASGGRNVLYIGGSTYNMFAGGGAISGGTISAGFDVLAGVFNGASSKLYKNGAEIASGNVGSEGLGGITLGADASTAGNWIHGDIAEWIVFDTALTTQEREAWETYLNINYALNGLGSVTSEATGPKTPAVAGATYSFKPSRKGTVAGGTAYYKVQWYDKTDALISTTTVWSATPTTGWVEGKAQATAPANTAYFVEVLGYTHTAAGTVYWDVAEPMRVIGNTDLGVVTDSTRFAPQIETEPIIFYDDSGAPVGQLSYDSAAERFTLESLTPGGGTFPDLEFIPASGTSYFAGLIDVAGAIRAGTFINAIDEYRVSNAKVVGAQGAAVANATGAGDVVAQLNTLLARLRAHGLIAT